LITARNLVILTFISTFTAACDNGTASPSFPPSQPTSTATAKPVEINKTITAKMPSHVAAVDVQEPTTAPSVQEQPKSNPPNADMVDINTADADTLSEKLYGIGPKKAQAIIDYREKYGLFRSLNDLEEVSGIGPKTIAMNKDKIFISVPNANQTPASVSMSNSTPPTAPAKTVTTDNTLVE
jgi:competence protein ComEA